MREGGDALIVTTGITLKTALDAAEQLAGSGLQAAVVHVPTVKPLDAETLTRHCRQSPIVVTVEEHSVIGGLGSAVAELLAEADLAGSTRFRRVGIPDVFPDRYGSQASLMQRYDITAEHVCSLVLKLRS
jgi:transketolase